MSKKLSNIFLILTLIVGLSLLLYPSFSDYWNSLHQSRAIANYAEQVANMNAEKYAEIWEATEQYNQDLLKRENVFFLTDEWKERYVDLHNISGNGVIGYIEIPEIKVSYPIYHGTEESVLQIAVGHLEWTSLPGGGEGTHCVLSGHRGLPSAKLFTDLDKLENGDIFMLKVLDQVFTYEMDQAVIVEPQDTDELLVVPGEDYCSLVTCTPYGINSHRLLVRGHRIENQKNAKTVRIVSEAIQIEPLVVAPFIAIPLLIVAMILTLFSDEQDRSHDMNKANKHSQNERR